MCSEPTGLDLLNPKTWNHELISVIGGTCGAVFLDDRFQNQMKTLAGDHAFTEMGKSRKLDLMDKWEYGAKRVFRHDCSDQQDWSYYIGGSTAREVLLNKCVWPAQQIYAGNNKKVRGHLNGIFGGICIKVADLVGIQVKAVKAMTGTFPKVCHLACEPSSVSISLA